MVSHPHCRLLGRFHGPCLGKFSRNILSLRIDGGCIEYVANRPGRATAAAKDTVRPETGAFSGCTCTTDFSRAHATYRLSFAICTRLPRNRISAASNTFCIVAGALAGALRGSMGSLKRAGDSDENKHYDVLH